MKDAVISLFACGEGEVGGRGQDRGQDRGRGRVRSAQASAVSAVQSCRGRCCTVQSINVQYYSNYYYPYGYGPRTLLHRPVGMTCAARTCLLQYNCSVLLLLLPLLLRAWGSLLTLGLCAAAFPYKYSVYSQSGPSTRRHQRPGDGEVAIAVIEYQLTRHTVTP